MSKIRIVLPLSQKTENVSKGAATIITVENRKGIQTENRRHYGSLSLFAKNWDSLSNLPEF